MMPKESSILKRKPQFFTKSHMIQLGYGFLVNQINVCFGMAQYFWIRNVPNKKVNFSGYIMLLQTLASPIGSILGGIAIDRFGRRPIAILCLAPMAAGWFIISFSSQSWVMVLGRILKSFGMGLSIAPPRIYGVEIANKYMRGPIGALPTLGHSVGIFFQSLLAYYFTFEISSSISGIYSVLVMVSCMLLPETPQYVLVTDYANTEMALKRFRDDMGDDLKYELRQLKKYCKLQNIRKLTYGEQMKFFFNKRRVYIPFFMSVMYSLIGDLGGTTVLRYYPFEMVQDSNISVNADTGKTVMEVFRIVIATILIYLLFRFKRRDIAGVSALLGASEWFVLALYIKRSPRADMMPLFGFLFHIAVDTVGYHTLPLLILFELLPLPVRGVIGGYTVSVHTLIESGVIYVYPYAKNWVGYPDILYFFGVVSLIGIIFIGVLLPETSASLLKISQIYRRKKFIDHEEGSHQRRYTITEEFKTAHFPYEVSSIIKDQQQDELKSEDHPTDENNAFKQNTDKQTSDINKSDDKFQKTIEKVKLDRKMTERKKLAINNFGDNSQHIQDMTDTETQYSKDYLNKDKNQSESKDITDKDKLTKNEYDNDSLEFQLENTSKSLERIQDAASEDHLADENHHDEHQVDLESAVSKKITDKEKLAKKKAEGDLKSSEKDKLEKSKLDHKSNKKDELTENTYDDDSLNSEHGGITKSEELIQDPISEDHLADDQQRDEQKLDLDSAVSKQITDKEKLAKKKADDDPKKKSKKDKLEKNESDDD